MCGRIEGAVAARRAAVRRHTSGGVRWCGSGDNSELIRCCDIEWDQKEGRVLIGTGQASDSRTSSGRGPARLRACAAENVRTRFCRGRICCARDGNQKKYNRYYARG